MASPLTIVARSHYRVSRLDHQNHHQSMNDQQQRPKLMPTDWFKFYINVNSRSIDSNSLVNLTTLLNTCQEIGCKSFFQEGQDFLRSQLSHPNFPSESLDQIIPRIVFDVKQMFDDSLASDPDPGFANPWDLQCHGFPLFLQIVVDVLDDGEHAVIEESMEEVRMIPASKEAIQSLKELKLTKQCNICMEEFHFGGDDDGVVEVSSMPCDHVFHHQCIVRWLQTNHMCPMCNN